MADVVSIEKRSSMMAGIRSKDTKPELIIRKGLHRAGFRYGLHSGKLPGKPDLVFSKYHAVIFINGCFWHMHSCHFFKMPSSRKEFWVPKLERNRIRDQKNITSLQHDKWRVCIIWECALRGKNKIDFDLIIDRCSKWLLSEKSYLEVKGL